MTMTTDTLPSLKLLSTASSSSPSRAERLWELLTAPHPTITTTNDRRQARLAAVVILGILGMFALELAFVPTQPGYGPMAVPILLTCAGLLLAYGIVRARYVTIGAVFAISFGALSVVGQVIAIPPELQTTSTLASSLQWLVLPLVVGGLVLTPQTGLLVALVSIIGIVFWEWLTPQDYSTVVTGGAIGFTATIAVVLTFVRYVQERYLVRPQLQELEQAARLLERKNIDLERANREMRDFAYIVAHDLRAPLVNLNGFVNEAEFAFYELQSALTAAAPHLDESTRTKAMRAAERDMPEALAYLQTNAAQMRSLIDQVLKIARVGKQELQIQSVDLYTTVKKIATTMNHQLDERGVELHLGQLPTIQADSNLLEQVLNNLLDNAIKYLVPDRPARIDVYAEVLPGEAIIHVRDNGRGIEEADYAKVFQLFRRARNVDDVPGDGFGLPYIQSMIQRQGGRIWFESVPGKGTTFSFSLPQSEKGTSV
jgi:signal transduction histidine kinase